MSRPGQDGQEFEPPVPEGLGEGAPVAPGDLPTRPDPVVPGPVRPEGTPGQRRSAEQIRADMDARRLELGRSVDTLREKVVEATDWRSQLHRHRKQILIGAVATGFVVGGLLALRRR